MPSSQKGRALTPWGESILVTFLPRGEIKLFLRGERGAVEGRGKGHRGPCTQGPARAVAGL